MSDPVSAVALAGKALPVAAKLISHLTATDSAHLLDATSKAIISVRNDREPRRGLRRINRDQRHLKSLLVKHDPSIRAAEQFNQSGAERATDRAHDTEVLPAAGERIEDRAADGDQWDATIRTWLFLLFKEIWMTGQDERARAIELGVRFPETGDVMPTFRPSDDAWQAWFERVVQKVDDRINSDPNFTGLQKYLQFTTDRQDAAAARLVQAGIRGGVDEVAVATGILARTLPVLAAVAVGWFAMSFVDGPAESFAGIVAAGLTLVVLGGSVVIESCRSTIEQLRIHRIARFIASARANRPLPATVAREGDQPPEISAPSELAGDQAEISEAPKGADDPVGISSSNDQSGDSTRNALGRSPGTGNTIKVVTFPHHDLGDSPGGGPTA